MTFSPDNLNLKLTNNEYGKIEQALTLQLTDVGRKYNRRYKIEPAVGFRLEEIIFVHF